MTATLSFVDKDNQPVTTTAIGDEVFLVAKSEQTGPKNMMLMDCTATRVGGSGDAVPFKVIENGSVVSPDTSFFRFHPLFVYKYLIFNAFLYAFVIQSRS